jgi:hypothetical protein
MHRRDRFQRAIGEGIPISRGDARIPTGASLPFDRQNQRRLPRLPERSHKPLACGGPDAVWNLQWQTIADAKAKDRWERRACGR